MKKIASILAALMLMLSLCATALADNEYATAFDLYQAWYAENGYENPYPDYITGVWSADGSMDHFVFGVTDDEQGEAGKAEILRLVADDTTVDFAYQNYSYAELLAIQQEIAPRMGDATGAFACGVYDMENVLKISIDESNPNAEDFMAEMFEKYGDRVAFEKGDGILLTNTAVDAAASDSAAILPAMLGLLAILMAVVLPAFLRRNKKEHTK